MRTGPLWLVVMALCLSATLAQAAAPDGGDYQVTSMIREGKDLYNQGKYPEAVAKFREVLKLDTDNVIAHHYLARLHGLLKQFKAAIDYIRELQRLGVSIYRSEDSKTTLNTVMSGILGVEEMAQRAELLIHLRETIQGLPVSVERRIDAHLMAIYAKQGENQLHEVVKTRYFQAKPIDAPVFFTAARTYIEYGVRLPEAASYFEQAIDKLKQQELPGTGNPDEDRRRRKLLDAEITVAEDFLAYTYASAGLVAPEKNRFVAAEPIPKTTFVNVTEAAGLKDVVGPRVAVGDYDGDGYEDLCITGRVFKNERGKGFTDVTEKVKVDPRNVVGALWLDYDGDGHLDLLFAAFPSLRLWRNKGDETFEEVTQKTGLASILPGMPEAIAVADYDGDGRLDLFVACFEHPQRPAVGLPNFLLRNTGGKFEDVSHKAGLRPKTTVPNPKTKAEEEAYVHYCTRGAAWCDFNGDGKPDLYVANYRLHPNRLWVNQGNGTFEDKAEELGVRGIPGEGKFASAFGHSIGCAWGDLNGDGRPDLVVTNLAMPNFLHFSDTTAVYFNGGEGAKWRFTDATARAGIRYEGMVADTSMADFDNDGDLDLYFTAIYKERPTFLYQNDGEGSFRAVTWRAGAVAFNTWGQAWFDKDNDGDLDLVLGSAAGVKLLENQARGTAWVRVKLVGKAPNKQAIGSTVTVSWLGKKAVREITCGAGTASQSSPIAHVGLGGFTGSVTVAVRWPDGTTQTEQAVRANALATIEQK